MVSLREIGVLLFVGFATAPGTCVSAASAPNSTSPAQLPDFPKYLLLFWKEIYYSASRSLDAHGSGRGWPRLEGRCVGAARPCAPRGARAGAGAGGAGRDGDDGAGGQRRGRELRRGGGRGRHLRWARWALSPGSAAPWVPAGGSGCREGDK